LILIHIWEASSCTDSSESRDKNTNVWEIQIVFIRETKLSGLSPVGIKGEGGGHVAKRFVLERKKGGKVLKSIDKRAGDPQFIERELVAKSL